MTIYLMPLLLVLFHLGLANNTFNLKVSLAPFLQQELSLLNWTEEKNK